MAEKWSIQGEYLENCNCDVLCPCIHSGMQAKPTEGTCDVPLLFHIGRGNYGDVRLDGLNVMNLLHTPGPMGEGNWSVALYIDERTDDRQREALEGIFSGQVGGPMAAIAPLITNFLGVKFVPIEYRSEGKKRGGSIPDILDMEVEAITGADSEEPIWIDNAPHPASTRLAVARSTKGKYTDHGFNWDNTGKNGHYATIEWAGP